MYFETIAQLIAQTSVPLNTEFVVGGYDMPGDGGGGTFIWIVPTTSFPYPDDGGIVLYAADTQGYFQRIFSGPINVRWFGAKGDGDVNPSNDDTDAVHRARDSRAFANNGTLYFPKGTYNGAFIFDFQPSSDPNDPIRNEINIIGDGHGTVLRGLPFIHGQPNNEPVVTLGYRTLRGISSNWSWARISDLTIYGIPSTKIGHRNGIEFANPSDPSLDGAAGRWAVERILFLSCNYGVYKKDGNIGNHFIDCTWNKNKVGVWAQTKPNFGANAASDRYSGGSFDGHSEACLRYSGAAPQLIVDGSVFEYNHKAWAILIEQSGDARMTWSGICIRNVWFEDNGDGRQGGALSIEGVRSVRLDDCGINGRIRLVDSSVNLYNCKLDSDAGGIKDDIHHVDDKSSLVAYEHRYLSYPTSKVFVNSISYDASQEIYISQPYPNPPMIEVWQPTSVWGPLRSLISTRRNIVTSTHFDNSSNPEWFQYVDDEGHTGGYVATTVSSMHVLGKGSGKLLITPTGDHYRLESMNSIGILKAGEPRYVVWSVHTFLESSVPDGHIEDELYGNIRRNWDQFSLGRIYFKHNTWACSYGMKRVEAQGDWYLMLEFKSAFDATFYITDFQIIEFDNLHDANAYVNSREFAIPVDREEGD